MQENIDIMIGLCSKKRDQLEELLKLSKVQEDIIKKGQVEDLERLLNDKGTIMGKIDEIDKDFISYYIKLKQGEHIVSIDQIDTKKYKNLISLKNLVKEINHLLKSLDLLDKNNINKMKAGLELVKSDLRQVKEVKRAYKGYNFEEVGSILIDEKK